MRRTDFYERLEGTLDGICRRAPSNEVRRNGLHQQPLRVEQARGVSRLLAQREQPLDGAESHDRPVDRRAGGEQPACFGLRERLEQRPERREHLLHEGLGVGRIGNHHAWGREQHGECGVFGWRDPFDWIHDHTETAFHICHAVFSVLFRARGRSLPGADGATIP